MTQPDPIGETTPETAHALLYRHGLPEDVIDGALCLHAQELTAVQREFAEQEDAHLRTTSASVYVQGIRDAADRIDPAKGDDAPAVSPSADRAAEESCVCGEPEAPGTVHRTDGPCYIADRAALRDRIARAARTVPLRLGPNAAAMAQRGKPVILNMSEADRLADAVLSVLPEPVDAAAVRAEALPSSTAPLAAGLPLVKGRCPACGTAGLFLGNGGYVTCSLIDCPEPDAASVVLERTLEARQDPAHAVGMPCEHGCRAAADQLTREARQDEAPGGEESHTGGNAEDCPICRPQIDKTVLYPWICTGATPARSGQPETDDLHPAVAMIEPCPGFPDSCPNLVQVQPDPPHHGGGVRCGCGDELSSS
ncbi:hypothetical protein [Streptomyces sp. NPDC091383]|uniref:hypothetical protein n=1 Tax=Streptomyces sp. NPDC091383 TaxID=3365996 RepID=UPI0037F7A4C3